jgi:hypothetical protein
MLKKTLRSPQAGFVLIDVDSCLGGVIIFWTLCSTLWSFFFWTYRYDLCW